MVTQKISVSLDRVTMKFIETYLKRHSGKSRSQVIAEALRSLQRQEQAAQLEAGYAMSAAPDRLIAAEFSGVDNDGLVHEAW